MMIKKLLPLLFLFAGFHVNATIIDVTNSQYLGADGGPLTGAHGVSVGEVLYDVTFQDGTCVALFSGCDESSDFAFKTAGAAGLASKALMNQVFGGDSFGSGFYDTADENGWAYGDHFYATYVTPYATLMNNGTMSVIATDFINSSEFKICDGMCIDPGDDRVTVYQMRYNQPNDERLMAGLEVDIVYAVWDLATSSSKSVPEPSIIALFALGFAGLGFARRRQS
jgi:hypothetical protein